MKIFFVDFQVGSLIQVVKEYKCSGPLLNYLTLEKPQNRKDFIFNLLLQVSSKIVSHVTLLVLRTRYYEQSSSSQ